MSDEEEKQPAPAQEEDIEQVMEEYSDILFKGLQGTSTEAGAKYMIKDCLKSLKDKVKTSSPVGKQMQKSSKDYHKERKVISDAIKKLMSENVTLKKGVKILVHKNEENIEKAKQFDNLAQAYNPVSYTHLTLPTICSV